MPSNRNSTEPESSTPGPDFSNVTSREKAIELVEMGELEPLYLMPLEFGGPDDDRNIVYVPVGIADIKQDTDLNIIGPLVESGQVRSYVAIPEYTGRSFVPISIKVVASDPGRFESEIMIWGEALERESEFE